MRDKKDLLVFGAQAGIERILVVKGVPQSEEPRTLLFGFTVWFLLDAVL